MYNSYKSWLTVKPPICLTCTVMIDSETMKVIEDTSIEDLDIGVSINTLYLTDTYVLCLIIVLYILYNKPTS